MISKEIAEQATHGSIFYHKTFKNADGTAVRARVNGKCKTWKTRPAEFQIPVKIGFKEHSYICPGNASDWTTIEPLTDKQLKALLEIRLKPGSSAKILPINIRYLLLSLEALGYIEYDPDEGVWYPIHKETMQTKIVCYSDPGTGEVYTCTDKACPIHSVTNQLLS